MVRKVCEPGPGVWKAATLLPNIRTHTRLQRANKCMLRSKHLPYLLNYDNEEEEELPNALLLPRVPVLTERSTLCRVYQ